MGGYVKLLQRRFPQNMDAKALEYINGAVEGAEPHGAADQRSARLFARGHATAGLSRPPTCKPS